MDASPPSVSAPNRPIGVSATLAAPPPGPLPADAAAYSDGRLAPAEWYEGVYAHAHGDRGAVPWAHARANPMLVTWLNTCAPGLVRTGGRVAVVGCGLGDDAAELAARGYDVTGFDVSPTAVEWACARFPELARSLVVADLLALPPRYLRRFDLVVEIYTLQSLPPTLRAGAAGAVASLAGAARGAVLTICRARGADEPLDAVPGPPWPFTAGELSSLMTGAGLRAAGPIDDFEDDERPPVRRLRAVFTAG